jgi:hypothetical protein
MTVKLNSSGVPAGTGSLQVRGRTYWMIYADETGRKIQANTGMVELADARRVLAYAATKVLRARLAALREVLDENPHQTAGRSQGDHRASFDSRSRAHGKEPAKATGAGGTHSSQRSARKGAAA